MRKFRIFSSYLVAIVFISFFSFYPGSKHFIQLGNEVWAVSITSTVVNQAYDTSGNGGRKLVRLSNGWLVCAAEDYATYLRFEVSKDNGATWTQLCSWITTPYSFSIASKGTTVYALSSANNGTVNIVNFDATTVPNNYRDSTAVTIDTQGFMGTSSLAIDASGVLYAAWSCKTDTLPNSYNIRYAKSINGGTTWTKADGTSGVDQCTTVNASGVNYITPCIVYLSALSKPIIIANYGESSLYKTITVITFNGAVWSNSTDIYNGSYNQSNPCAVVAPNGRIWVAWHGKDLTDSTYDNIRCKYSDDNGASWNNGGVSNDKITSTSSSYNQRNPSITCDSNNYVYIVWNGALASSSNNMNIRKIVRTGSTWSNIVEVTNQNVADIQYPSVCTNYTFFTDPLCIYQDNQVGKVIFRGEYGTPPIVNPQSPTQNAALFPNLHSAERSA